MIHKGRVLFRIQHFQHCRCRVAAEILAHFVDFIQQDQRIAGLCLFQSLNDLTRHRADIGTTVTTNFAFVAHTTKGDANKLTTRGFGHRFTKRCLTNTGRANQTHDRALHLGRTLLHSQILNDAFFDFFQTIMIIVQDFLRADQVLLHAGFHTPRNAQHPIQIVADNSGLSRHRRHVLELLNFRVDLFTGFFAKLGRADLLVQLVHLVLAVFAVTQLLLDRFHLFVQIILTLRAFHLCFDAGFDLLLNLQNRHLALHQAIDLLKTFRNAEGLKQVLLLLNFDP